MTFIVLNFVTVWLFSSSCRLSIFYWNNGHRDNDASVLMTSSKKWNRCAKPSLMYELPMKYPYGETSSVNSFFLHKKKTNSVFNRTDILMCYTGWAFRFTCVINTLCIYNLLSCTAATLVAPARLLEITYSFR